VSGGYTETEISAHGVWLGKDGLYFYFDNKFAPVSFIACICLWAGNDRDGDGSGILAVTLNMSPVCTAVIQSACNVSRLTLHEFVAEVHPTDECDYKSLLLSI